MKGPHSKCGRSGEPGRKSSNLFISAKKETTIFGRRLSFLFVFSLFSQIVVSGEKRRGIRFAEELNYIARARIHTQNGENIFFNRYAVESKTAVWYDLLNKLEFAEEK